jgi:hypothetical protein
MKNIKIILIVSSLIVILSSMLKILTNSNITKYPLLLGGVGVIISLIFIIKNYFKYKKY